MGIGMLKHICRLCHSSNLSTLIDFGKRPITKRLLISPPLPQSAEFTYQISLDVCRDCGFVQISDAIPQDELYTNYVLSTSWKPQPHLKDEIDELLKNRYISESSFVVEIGCNDGIALELLRQCGVRNLLGIEPSRDVAEKAAESGFMVINDYFMEEKADFIVTQYGKADLIICRQVLEHITYIDSFMHGIQGLIKSGGTVLFEVPDFSIPLKYGDITAAWEEHVNYFTEDTLIQLLARYGFRSLILRRYNFSGGALCVFAKYSSEKFSSFRLLNEEELNYILCYPQRIESFLKKVVDLLKEEKKGGGKVAIYGAGNRSVILLNYRLKEFVDIVVDDQPEKQNRFVPLCHLPILPPDELIKQHVKVCLLAVNAENEESVMQKNKNYEENGGKFLSVLSPSAYLIGKNEIKEQKRCARNI